MTIIYLFISAFGAAGVTFSLTGGNWFIAGGMFGTVFSFGLFLNSVALDIKEGRGDKQSA